MSMLNHGDTPSPAIHCIALTINPQKDPALIHTKALLPFFSGANAVLRFSAELASVLQPECEKYGIRAEFPASPLHCTGTECVIVLGGDGSVMRTAVDAAVMNIPVLGINLGRVGYLAEVEPSDLAPIRNLFCGKYRIENRMMLDITIFDKDGGIREHTKPALNEAVISNGAISHMVELMTYVNGDALSSLHADGLICATPTGSTAYSMSAGGPVIEPTLDCICMTPVCSHSLDARPIVFSADTELKIQNIGVRDHNTYLTIDGSEHYHLKTQDAVCVRKSGIPARLIRFSEAGVSPALFHKLAHKTL